MNDHDGARALGEVLLKQRVVNLKGVPSRLNEHRPQPVLADGEDGGNIGVGRHHDLVALTQQSHLQIGAVDERQRIEAVANAYAMARADVRRVFRLEGLHLLTLQEPPRVDHPPYCLMILLGVEGRHLLKVKELNHVVLLLFIITRVPTLYCICPTKKEGNDISVAPTLRSARSDACVAKRRKNYQLSTLNYQLSTIRSARRDACAAQRSKNSQLSTINYQLSTLPSAHRDACGAQRSKNSQL